MRRPVAGREWPESPHAFLRWPLAAEELKAVFDGDPGQQMPMVWQCPVWTGVPIPFQHQHEPTSGYPVEQGGYPSVLDNLEAVPVEGVPLEIPLLMAA